MYTYINIYICVYIYTSPSCMSATYILYIYMYIYMYLYMYYILYVYILYTYIYLERVIAIRIGLCHSLAQKNKTIAVHHDHLHELRTMKSPMCTNPKRSNHPVVRVQHHAFQCVTYRVAPIRRLLQNIGLFCKRALQKRPIFWKRDLSF